jgi:hypothetical protein
MGEFLGKSLAFFAIFAGVRCVLRGQDLFVQKQEQETLTAKNAKSSREGREEIQQMDWVEPGASLRRKLQTLYNWRLSHSCQTSSNQLADDRAMNCN